MGRSMYNAKKRGKEIARQQKQKEKAAKRALAKQNKANPALGSLDAQPDIAELAPQQDSAQSAE